VCLVILLFPTGLGRRSHCVCVPVLLVVECACVSFWSGVSFGWSVGTGVQEVEGDV
jgi:hypothetical protein